KNPVVIDLSKVLCFKCERYGHFQKDCTSIKRYAKYLEWTSKPKDNQSQSYREKIQADKLKYQKVIDKLNDQIKLLNIKAKSNQSEYKPKEYKPREKKPRKFKPRNKRNGKSRQETKPFVKKEKGNYQPKREFKSTRKNFQGKPMYKESKDEIRFSNPNNVEYKPSVPKQFNPKKQEYNQDGKYLEEIRKKTQELKLLEKLHKKFGNKEVHNFEHDEEYDKYSELCEKYQEVFHFEEEEPSYSEEEPSDKIILLRAELSNRKLHSKVYPHPANDDQISRSEDSSEKSESEATIYIKESDFDSSSDSSISDDSSENSDL
ncbi:13399_t:CDS:2, partial [Racocetra persica]